MTGSVDEQRLPASIGGLVDLAFASLAERAPLYLALSLAVFAAGAIVEFAIPAAKLGTPPADLKLLVFQYTSVFADSFVIAAVALGIGTRVADETASARTIAGATVSRWLPVIGVNLIVQFVQIGTLSLSGVGELPDPPALALVTAPLTWLLWGALGLAAPIAALSADRPTMAIFSSILRALVLSLHPTNLVRLCVVAFASILPTLLQNVAYDQAVRHHVSRAVFLANVPIDALTVVVVAAVQTVFALDFARRLGRLDTPKKH
ncbi:MAG: hypothetical protein ABI186_02765 [Candidatus Elarobacter sp.]